MEFWVYRVLEHDLSRRGHCRLRVGTPLDSVDYLVVKVWPEKSQSVQQTFVGFLLSTSTVLVSCET